MHQSKSRTTSLLAVPMLFPLLGCSGGAGGDDAAAARGDVAFLQTAGDAPLAGGGSGGSAGQPGTGSGGTAGGGSAGAVDCTPYNPPIPCTPTTACPSDSYCDRTQSPSVCMKFHCLLDGASCAAVCSGGQDCPYCRSGLCSWGSTSPVCFSPVGEGAPCWRLTCIDPFRCLGTPAVCVRPRAIGGDCQDEGWCVNSVGSGPSDGSPIAVYCLNGICANSQCLAPNATAMGCAQGSTVSTKMCDPGYDCIYGLCSKLYCGTDGSPCSTSDDCATGFICSEKTAYVQEGDSGGGGYIVGNRCARSP